VAISLRQQAEECLRVARETQDEMVRMELLTAAAWLHEKAKSIEAALRQKPK
jgi:hypothetical protein